VADVYLRSADGNDADDGSTWALADATLAASLTAAGASGRTFMSDNHSESTAGAITHASPGGAGTTTAIICVDDTGDPQPPTALATTGIVATTGAGANISGSGHAAMYGVTYNCSSAASTGNIQWTSASSWAWTLLSCQLNMRGTSSNNRIITGSTSGTMPDTLLELHACDVNTTATGQAFNPGATTRWYGGNLTVNTAPTGGLVKPLVGMSTLFEARGINLDALSTNAVLAVGTGSMGGAIDFLNCRLNAGYSIPGNLTTGTVVGPGQPRLRMHNCAVGDTHFGFAEVSYEGNITPNSGVFVSGGASDGVTSYSHLFQTNANATFYFPLWGPRIFIPVYTTGSLTLTVEFFHDSATALHDGDIYYELEYAGTSGFPQSVFARGRRPILPTTTTNWGSSAVTWNGGGGFTNPNKQKMTIAVTVAEIGVFQLRIGVAKANYVVYVSPPTRAAVA